MASRTTSPAIHVPLARASTRARMPARSTYLVTGGCGFIGSHLADRLIALGHRVRVLDNLSTGRLANLSDGAELVVGDVADEATVHDALRDVDGCFHLAAAASVARCNADAILTNRINLVGTLTILATAGRHAIPVVYASSAAVYGANPSTPLGERSETRPLSVYAADKLACELHAAVASHLHCVPTVGLRFFNVYGPRQDPASPYSGVISIFADRLARGQELTVYGDGAQVRDFVFVGDVVDVIVAAMARQQPGAFVCNVCTGEGTTILALAKLLADLAGIRAEIRHAPARAGDVRISIGDPRRLAEAYGRVPTTTLRVGLRELLGPGVAARRSTAPSEIVIAAPEASRP
jgi:UDP-glucose 4-epimerase